MRRHRWPGCPKTANHAETLEPLCDARDTENHVELPEQTCGIRRDAYRQVNAAGIIAIAHVFRMRRSRHFTSENGVAPDGTLEHEPNRTESPSL